MKKLSTTAVAAAMAAGIALTASARTMNMTVNQSFGPVQSFDFTFDNVGASTTNKLLMACGASDGGSTFSGWDSIRFVADVPGDTTTLTGVTPPADWGTGVTHLRFFLTSGGTVPDAVLLDSIEATGTQYVMTDFKPNGASAVEMSFAFNPDHLNDTQCFFCSRAGSNTAPYFSLFWAVTATKWRMDYGTGKPSSSAMSPDGGIHALRVDSGNLVIDGTNYVSGSSASFDIDYTMSIFAANNSGSYASGFNGKFKLYSFKAWADGSNDSTLALDLVPCMKYDGTVCLYNKVDGEFLTNAGTGAFTAGDVGEAIAGVSTPVTFQAVAGGGTYTWVGGGADNNITTDGNWQGGHAPDFDAEAPLLILAGGTAAVLDRGISVSGIAFDGVADFTISSSGNYGIALGEGGISNAPAAAARAVTVAVPIMPLADQVWQMETNTTFTLSGVLRKCGTPTLTVRQGSRADPTIHFIGAATAEGASNFAGDVVFEETALPDGNYGTAYVRASGYEPFGPVGTLELQTLGSGRGTMGRYARLHLSNAVISKAVKYSGQYLAEFQSEANTTNVMNGAFTPSNTGTWGTYPPSFRAGANSLLRLCGELDFGTHTAENKNLMIYSTAGAAADMPSGTVVFDGIISRLPRGLEFANPICLELNAANNAITNLYLRHGNSATGVVRFGTSYALAGGQATVTFPQYPLRPVDFDLNGTVQHILGFAPGAGSQKGSTSRISSTGTPGTLRVSQATDVEFEGSVATNVTIQMEGAATLTFSHATAFNAGSTLVVSNGTVAVSSATGLNEGVTLKLLGGQISIPEGRTAQVGEAFYLDGNGEERQLAKGTYGPGDGAVGAFFASGSGSIQVKSGLDSATVISFR